MNLRNDFYAKCVINECEVTRIDYLELDLVSCPVYRYIEQLVEASAITPVHYSYANCILK